MLLFFFPRKAGAFGGCFCLSVCVLYMCICVCVCVALQLFYRNVTFEIITYMLPSL